MDREQIEATARKAGVTPAEVEGYLAALETADAPRREALRALFARARRPVLELGAGDGTFTREILASFLPADGRLYALERLAEPAERLRREIEDPRLTVLTSEGAVLPLPDGAVDLVVSRVTLHDFVSADGDAARALVDCVRVLAPGGAFVIEDQTVDGFADPERESAEARMERINSQFASLEGKRCWGLHRRADYEILLRELGLGPAQHVLLPQPDAPGYVRFLLDALSGLRASYTRRLGEGAGPILDALEVDLANVPARALPRVLVWAEKPEA